MPKITLIVQASVSVVELGMAELDAGESCSLLILVGEMRGEGSGGTLSTGDQN